MPDWSYRPLLKPWMLRSPVASHALALRVLGTIASTRLAYCIIDLLGHMAPPAGLARPFASMKVVSPIGFGAVIDPSGRAFRAFERFGVGFIELGPVGLVGAVGELTVDLAQRSILGRRPVVPRDEFIARAKIESSRRGVKRLVRLESESDDEALALMTALSPYADAFIIPRARGAVAKDAPKPCGITVPAGVRPRVQDVRGAAFIVIDPEFGRDGETSWSPSSRDMSFESVALWHAASPGTPIVHAAGGVESPDDAFVVMAAGASLVALSHGFVHTGPGLPKRINEGTQLPPPLPIVAMLEPPPPPALTGLAQQAWPWGFMLGLTMLLGGVLATIFALTHVIMPYDEAATGLTSAVITAFNERLVHFMAHDRMTLAGTMVSLGVLYVGLALGGMRRGCTFAKEAIAISAACGFLSFFAFVGYGYFDQFHAFISAVLFPIAIQAVVGRDARRAEPGDYDMHNDRAWRRAVFGQLTFVMQGVGLLAAGTAIMTLGMTSVFVDSDLSFLGTTHDALRAHHANLVPLVAHDRATFGGMLISTGVCVLLTALWGFERGARWLWWTLTISGFPAYLATIWIHGDIGYTDALHLSPVITGLALQMVGVVATREFLMARRARP